MKEKGKAMAQVYIKEMKKRNKKYGGFQEYVVGGQRDMKDMKRNGNNTNNNARKLSIILPWNKTIATVKNSNVLKENVNKEKKMTIEVPRISE